MSYTYAELTTAIKDYTDCTETSFVTHIPDFVRNTEERLLKNVHHSVFKTSATITYSTSVESYLVPAKTSTTGEFIAPLSLTINENTNDHYFLEQKDFTYVKDLTQGDGTSTVNGNPRCYAVKNVQSSLSSDDGQPRIEIIVGPAPSSTYNGRTGTLMYVYRPISLVDTDTSVQYQETSKNGMTWLSVNAPRAMLFGSLVEASIYLKSAPDTMAMYEQHFQESLMGLKKLGESMEQQDEYRYGAIVREKM
jgi:hypothetical protein